MNPTLTLTFQSLRSAARVWTVRFELGSDEANQLAALRHARNHNARIMSDAAAEPAPSH